MAQDPTLDADLSLLGKLWAVEQVKAKTRVKKKK